MSFVYFLVEWEGPDVTSNGQATGAPKRTFPRPTPR